MKKVAIITGSASGIGKDVADRLSKYYTVYRIDEKFDNCSLEKNTFSVDVTNNNQIKQIFEKIYEESQNISVLVNCVGGTIHNKSIEEIDDTDYFKNMNLNLYSAFNCTRAVVPYMKIGKWGRIVNIAAVAGETSTFFGGVDFAAAKSGIIGLTRQCGYELAKFGILTNCISPGLTLTERVKDLLLSYDGPTKDKIMGNIAMGRASSINEQVEVIEFLCRPESSYICGATIDVNGGLFIN